MSVTQREKAERFRALHQGRPFLIPNPWDAGSAKVLAALGFEALATTSSGFAFTLGRPDGEATLEEVIEHSRALAEATDLPISVDLENGHGPLPADTATAIEAAAAAGAVGGSIEDFDPDRGLYEIVAAGARRVSVGGSLAWTAIEAMAASAEAMRDQGDLSTLAGASRIRKWLGS